MLNYAATNVNIPEYLMVLQKLKVLKYYVMIFIRKYWQKLKTFAIRE